MSRLLLPLEERTHAQPCRRCLGIGVTGERYTMTAGEHVLVLEVICPECGGCGNGDPEHAGCQAAWHAYPDDEMYPGPPDKDGDGDDDGADGCFSCGSGRGWFPIDGFASEGADTVAYILRGICSCATPRLVEAAADG